jgi:acyl-CoA reductase-like NAD-dependent aldehyde dehydrogenase
MNVYSEIEKLNVENRIFVNGKYVDAFSDGVFVRESSYDGSRLADLADCGKATVDYAVGCAKNAYESGVWRNLKISERKKIMLRLADIMEADRRELALLDTYETGRAYANYYNDSIPKAIEALRYFAEASDKYYDYSISPQQTAFSTMTRMPLGVVGIITPWNDPMVVAIWKIAPALLMGNSVVAKPAEQSSLSLLRTAKLASEAGVPDGVLNVITGTGEVTGKLLATNMDVRGIYFTGSSQVGKLIMQYAGQSNMKKVGLECGGKSPFIVSGKYRNIRNAASTLAQNMFYNQGQICTAPSRAIVDAAVYDEFVEYLKCECEKYIPGNPFDDENNVGCVVSRKQFDRINTYIRQAKQDGGRVYQAQDVKAKNEKACCVQPTIITGLDNDSKCVREEIFGPVVAVIKSSGIKESVKIANDTDYGLAGAVFTDDLNEAYYAANNINAGLVHINSWGEDDVHTPFGGIKESGLGKDRSMWAFDEYSELKTVWMKFDIGEA